MRTLNEKEKSEILSLKPEDITLKLLKQYFAVYDDKARFEPNDQIPLKANEYYNKEPIITTIGRIIVNKVLLDPDLIKDTGFINFVLDSDGIEKMNTIVINLFLAEKITIDKVYHYFDQCNWLAYAPTDFIVAGLTSDMYVIDPEVKKLKKKLIEENKEAIVKGDVVAMNNIEKQLLDLSKEKLKDKPGYQIYESGARGSFSNNYKNTVLLRGAVKNFTDPNTFNISTSSLVDGFDKEDFTVFAGITTAGTYARAKNTEKGGYLSKEVRSAFQHIMLDKKGSDCGSKKFLTITLDKSNIKLFLYRYIKKGDGLVLLTPDNINDYINKEVKMRSPLYCKGDCICNKCMGDLYFKEDIQNIGTLTDRVSSTIMQKSMKLFHNSTVKVMTLNYKSAISEIK